MAPSPRMLSDIPAGTRVRIQALRGGRPLLARLATFGVLQGAHLDVLQNYGHGPLLVQVRGTRLALGRGEAEHILVEVAP